MTQKLGPNQEKKFFKQFLPEEAELFQVIYHCNTKHVVALYLPKQQDIPFRGGCKI